MASGKSAGRRSRERIQGIRLEQHRRQAPGQWLMTEHTVPDEEIDLTSIDVKISLLSVYAGVLDGGREASQGL